MHTNNTAKTLSVYDSFKNWLLDNELLQKIFKFHCKILCFSYTHVKKNKFTSHFSYSLKKPKNCSLLFFYIHWRWWFPAHNRNRLFSLFRSAFCLLSCVIWTPYQLSSFSINRVNRFRQKILTLSVFITTTIIKDAYRVCDVTALWRHWRARTAGAEGDSLKHGRVARLAYTARLAALPRWPRSHQIWARSGSDRPQMGQIRDLFQIRSANYWIWKIPGFSPFGANLIHFVPESDPPENCDLNI